MSEKQHDYFIQQEQSLLAAGSTVNSAFTASTGIGNARERLISEFLEDHLPGQLAIKRGTVIGSHGASTGETDLIVADKSTGILNIGGKASVFAETAVACIEVKSGLHGDNLESAVRKIAEVKSLRRVDGFGTYHLSTDIESLIEIPPRSPMDLSSLSTPHPRRRLARKQLRTLIGGEATS